nr:transaldolase [Gemmatimonadota bacterium]
TIEAFRDHGVVNRTVDADYAAAERTMKELAAVGVVMSDVTDKLLKEGLASFQKSFETLTLGLQKKVDTL